MPMRPSRLDTVYRFFSGTGFSYDRIVNLWTCGFDRYWKNRIIGLLPPGCRRILDQACGTGILTLKIVRAFPDSEVIGVELREEYLDFARAKVRKQRLDNISFLVGRAEEVVPKGTFDCITSSYLAKYADLQMLLVNAGRILRPGGMILLHDFTYPDNPLLLNLWKTWFRLMQSVGGRLSPEWGIVFRELPEFLRTSHWHEETLDLLKKLNFTDITSIPLTFETSAIITARKPL